MSENLDLPAAADDPRVLQAVQEYLAELEAGRRPDRQSLLTRYADVADDLGPFLDALDVVHAGAPLLQAPPAPESPLAEPLGDFRILREIGRGGMGVVYEAVQLSLGRRVALKVLPFAATLDGRQLQRFKNEAQAAAQLHHTNIVPVYAVGCERGMHFYAMQLIEGRTLDEVIRELRGDPADGPRSNATTQNQITAIQDTPPERRPPSATAGRSLRDRESFRSAARLAAQAADALEYAHDAGVVHRDIKPANLLLDTKGNLWITDFGLAQVSAEVSLTRTGDLLGTLRYMSPEQASGRGVQIDHRCDVYSLGVTLYELLTLQHAFPGENRQTVLHQILNDEPKPPRQIDRSIPTELETIVLKAVSKSPSDRYATAGEFAADLRRFLEERPILARRPSLLDRGRKWVRRHPAVVGAMAVLLLFAVVGFAASTALISREQTRTKNALLSEQRRAMEAEQRFQLARRSADEMIRIANEELSENPAQQALRRRLLEAALSYYQEFIELRGGDHDAQLDLESTRDRVRLILTDLAILEGAWQHNLLRDAAVRDDLQLVAAQRQRLDELLKDLGPRTGEFRPRPPRSQRFVEEVKAHEAAIRDVLKPEQLARLRQIALQVRGLFAFRQPDVIAALQLTPDQRDRIRAIESEAMFAVFEGPRGGGLRSNNPPRPPGVLITPRQLFERVTGVLNESQTVKWQSMIGEPFRGASAYWFPEGPGPFGPAGPRGPRPE